MMALARKLVTGETDDCEVEDIFQQTQQIAAEAEDLLVDADWERAGPEAAPQVVPSTSDVPVESLVELVPCSSHLGQGEQQTLFSWAQFLAERPDEPKLRGGNPRPSGPSLFDWALEREQEAGLAAAGG